MSLCEFLDDKRSNDINCLLKIRLFTCIMILYVSFRCIDISRVPFYCFSGDMKNLGCTVLITTNYINLYIKLLDIMQQIA